VLDGAALPGIAKAGWAPNPRFLGGDVDHTDSQHPSLHGLSSFVLQAYGFTRLARQNSRTQTNTIERGSKEGALPIKARPVEEVPGIWRDQSTPVFNDLQ
jgi:hypothetical protein